MKQKIALWINRHLPIYLPNYSSKYCLAIWNCADCKRYKSLKYTLQDIRITIRRDGSPIFVIKKGEYT